MNPKELFWGKAERNSICPVSKSHELLLCMEIKLIVLAFYHCHVLVAQCKSNIFAFFLISLIIVPVEVGSRFLQSYGLLLRGSLPFETHFCKPSNRKDAQVAGAAARFQHPQTAPVLLSQTSLNGDMGLSWGFVL